MARQVFFDPFGKATEGYNLGMQQEQNLQQNMRQARQSDWDYQNMNPYRLAATQREDVLGQAALPYQIQMPAVGLDAAKTHLAAEQEPMASNFAASTGMTGPLTNVWAHLFGLIPNGAAPNGGMNYTMRGTDGQQYNAGSIDPTALMQHLGLPLQMEYQKAQAMNNYYNGMALYGRGGQGAFTLDMAKAGQIGAPPAQGISPVSQFFRPQAAGGPTQQPQQSPQMAPFNLPPQMQPPQPYQMPQQPNYMPPSQLSQPDQGY